MAENPIKNTDFYDGDGDPFKEVVKNILELETVYDRLTKKIKDGVATLKQLSSAVNSKDIKAQSDVTKELEKNTADLVKTEQALVKEKIEAQKLIKLQLQLDKETKANQDKLAKSTEQQTSAYKEQTVELNKLRNRYKDLAAEEKNLTEDGRKLLTQIEKLDDKLKKIDATVGQHQRNVGNYAGAWDKVKGAMLVASSVIAGVTGSLWIANKAIDASGSLTDDWERTIASANASWNIFVQSMVRWDWDKFGAKISAVSKAAADYADVMDRENDKLIGISIQEKKNRGEILKLKEDLLNVNLAYAEREKIARKIIDLEDKGAADRLESSKKTKDALLNQIAVATGTNKKMVELYFSEAINNEKLQKSLENIAVAWNKIKKEAQIASNITKTNVQPKYSDLEKTFGKTWVQIFKVTQALDGLSDTEKKSVQEAIELQIDLGNELQERKNSVMKRLNTLLSKSEKENTKTDKEESEKRIRQAEKEAGEKALLASGGLKPKNLTQLADTTEVGPTKRTGFGLTDYEMRQAKSTAEDAAATELKIIEDKENKKQALIKATFDAAYGLTETLGNLFEAQKNRELQAAGNNAKKKEEIERKYAKKEQKLAISRAIITGAQAVLYASLLQPPANWISASLAATMVAGQVALIASQKFAKGGTWVEGGRLHSEGGNRYGDKELERGEQVSVFSRSATSKHNELITEFTNAINHDKLDLFSLNFAPKHVVVQQTDKRLVQLAEKQLQAQLKLNDNISNMPIISGNKTITKQGIRYVV